MMPLNDAIPYIAVHRREKTCDWYGLSSDEQIAAKEVAGVLVREMLHQTHLYKTRTWQVPHTLWESLEPSVQAVQITKPLFRAMPFKTPLKLSLHYFKALDDWMASSTEQEQISLEQILHNIVAFLYQETVCQGYDLGLSFQEVFLCAPGQVLPSHYRVGVDIVVETDAAYQQQTRTFSYQFAKAWFNRCCMGASPSVPSPTNAVVFERYQAHQALLLSGPLKEGLQRAVHSIRGFTQRMECATYLYLWDFHRFHNKPSDYAIVTFESSGFDAYSIRRAMQFVGLFDRSEVLFIVRGARYLDPSVRASLRDNLLSLVSERHTSLLHVILLTDANTEYSLYDLAPDLSQEDDLGFSPLAHDAGFYLSDARLFSMIYRRRQLDTPACWPLLELIKAVGQRVETNVRVAAPTYETYIVSPDGDVDVRPSKRLQKSALKARVALSIAEQQTMAMDAQQSTSEVIVEQQVLDHAQSLTEQQQHVQEQRHASQHLWKDTITFDAFCHQLQTASEKAYLHWESLLSSERTSYTKGHITACRDFFDALAHCDATRMDVATRLFGMCHHVVHGVSYPIELPAYSYRTIERSLANRLTRDVNAYTDGLNPDQLFFSNSRISGERVLDFLHYRARPLLRREVKCRDLFQLSSIHDSNERPHWRGVTGYYALWAEDALTNLSVDEKKTRQTLAESLLGVLDPHRNASIDVPFDVPLLEAQFIQFIQWSFPDKPEHVAIITRFIAQFEDHTTDNLRIMMHVLVSGGLVKMDKLIQLLHFFEARDLMHFFYKIYYQHAHTVLSVSLFLDSKSPTPFFDLACNVPPGVLRQEWPDFERFFLHALVFTQQHSLFDVQVYEGDAPFSPLDSIEAMRDYWHAMHIKCLHYANHQVQEAERLMTMLVQHLVQSDGLSIAPLRNSQTLFKGLACVLDHAIETHTLHEQLSEMQGLSLLWLDAPFAMRHQGFKVISHEMAITASQLNPTTQSYSVSYDELLETLAGLSYTPESDVKMLLFRYLGGQTFREDLAFYRQLFALFCPPVESETRLLRTMIIGYFIANTTGTQYTPRLNPVAFSAGLKAFIEQHTNSPLFPTLPSAIDACLGEFFEQYDRIPKDVDSGLVSLWHYCHHSMPTTRIPVILTKKFEEKTLVRFILAHQAELIDAMSVVVDELGESIACEWVDSLLRSIIHEHCRAYGVRLEKPPLRLLRHAYPNWTPALFFNEFVKIERFIEQYVDLTQGYEGLTLYAAFRTIMSQRDRQQDGIDVGLALMGVLSTQTNRQNLKQNTLFLNEIAKHDGLLNSLSRTQSLLKPIANAQQKQGFEPIVLHRLFAIASVVMMEEPSRALYWLEGMIRAVQTPEGARFLCDHALNASQLQSICTLMDHCNMPMSFIEWCFHPSQCLALNDIIDALAGLRLQQVASLLPIWYGIDAILPSTDAATKLAALQTLVALPDNTLEQWSALIAHQVLTPEQSLEILQRPSIAQTLREATQQQYSTHLERYAFDIEAVREKISRINWLLPNQTEGVPLPEALQAQLLAGYETLMAYMLATPILIERDLDAQEQAWTVNQLSDEQFAMLYARLKQLIRENDDAPRYKIMLLALACEAIYRTTHQFPRDTQLVGLLQTIYCKSGECINRICEIKTGEGKSLIAALYAVLFSVYGPVDVVTENPQLAMNGLNKYRKLFNSFKIPCRQETERNIIEANSVRRQYLDDGVNYGTFSDLTLYRIQMRFNKQPLPASSLVFDEIDAALTSTVLFRLATSLNPLLEDTELWSLIYRATLAFVTDRTLFLDNQCRQADDVQNLRCYLRVQIPNDKLASLLEALSNEAIESLIELALTTQGLEEGVDFLAVPSDPSNGYSLTYYAAPILEHTKRPDARVSYSDGVQSLLHARLSSKHRTFPIEPITETIVALSIKNAVDHYRRNGSRMIGLTGTGGSCIERQEFMTFHGLPVIQYPAFHADRCELLPLQAVNGEVEQRQAVIAALRKNYMRSPTQPVLIIMPSPKEVSKLCADLITAFDRPVLSYYGDKAGSFEEQLIHQAGLNGAITVATQSLARGADIETKHPDGIIVFNGCTNLTPEALRQIRGRSARNGHLGRFCSIIRADLIRTDSEPLDAMLEDMDEGLLLERFVRHQHQISAMQQRERLKTRLLDDARDRMVQQYFFNVKERGDALLSRQCGQWSTLIDHTDFLTTLRDFNHRAETHYHALLGEHDQLNAVDSDQFLEALVHDYQTALNRWLPSDKFQSFEAVEPLVALESLDKLGALNRLSVDELGIVSALLAHGWRHVGNQGMHRLLMRFEAFEQNFQPYFKGQCGFKTAAAETLIKQSALDVNKIQLFLDDCLNESTKALHETRQLPIVGYFIPVESIQRFLTEYVNHTKRQIEAEQWEALTLPQADFKAIEGWFSGLQTVATMASYGSALSGGPVLFIIQHIALPAIGAGLHALFKRWFAESDSIHVQMLLGLDSILSDARRALEFLLLQPDLNRITVGEALAKFEPLLTNKTFLALVRHGLEKNGYAVWVPYVQQGVALIPALAPYRDMPLSAFKQGSTLLGLFLSVCQLEPVQQVLEQTGFQDEVARIPELTPDFLDSFRDLDAEAFIGFMKLMAHPEWNACLQSLPSGTTLEQIRAWLSELSTVIPINAQPAMERLADYQLNRERLAENTRAALLSLHAQCNVSTAGFKNQLAADQPETANSSDPVSTPAHESTSPWRVIGLIAMVAIVVAVNVLCFSIPLLITTGLFACMLAYRYAKQMNQRAANTTPPTPLSSLLEQPLEPSSILIQTGPRVQSNIAAKPDGTMRPLWKENRSISESTCTEARNRYGLFGLELEPEQQNMPKDASNLSRTL